MTNVMSTVRTSNRWAVGLLFLALWAPRLSAQNPPARDWSIWMGTNRNTLKVREIERDPHVTLYYFSPELVGYVSLSGSALLVDDPAEKSKRWKEEWEGLYRDREADYLLIQVTPDRLEVVDYARGIGGNPETWDPPSVVFPAPPASQPPDGAR